MVKVGDLVRCRAAMWPEPADQLMYDYGVGIVVMLSKTGRRRYSARVQFSTGAKLMWFDSRDLEVISERR